MRVVDRDTLVSHDEAHVHNRMTRSRGWSRAGMKAFTTPAHHRRPERYSLMMAVSREKVIAWQVVDGSVDQHKFLSFLQEKLVTAVRASGMTHLLLDNTPIRHARVVQEYWASEGGRQPLIFNPPYHPDSNPIEIIKPHLRKRRPETRIAVESEIGWAVRMLVTTLKLGNVFQHALTV
jgi:hypothetical protein